MRDRSREAWKWLVVVLQFLGDEASIANGVVYGGRVRPISALAEYVFNAIERVQGQRDLVTKRESILIFLSTLFYK